MNAQFSTDVSGHYPGITIPVTMKWGPQKNTGSRSAFRHRSQTPNSADHRNIPHGRPRAQTAISAVRFGGGSDFGFHKPSPFFDLTASRSESRLRRLGLGSVGVGSAEKTLRILQLAGPVRVPHNPLVPGSSPGGPTIFYQIHSLMALRPGDFSCVTKRP